MLRVTHSRGHNCPYPALPDGSRRFSGIAERTASPVFSRHCGIYADFFAFFGRAAILSPLCGFQKAHTVSRAGRQPSQPAAFSFPLWGFQKAHTVCDGGKPSVQRGSFLPIMWIPESAHAQWQWQRTRSRCGHSHPIGSMCGRPHVSVVAVRNVSLRKKHNTPSCDPTHVFMRKCLPSYVTGWLLMVWCRK